jgi:hypothetical protein
MRLGRVEVTNELLNNSYVQNFLAEAYVLNSSPSFYIAGITTYLLEHPEFVDIPEGSQIPQYVVTFTQTDSGLERKIEMLHDMPF